MCVCVCVCLSSLISDLALNKKYLRLQRYTDSKIKKKPFSLKCFVQKLGSYLLTVANVHMRMYMRARATIARALGSWAGHI